MQECGYEPYRAADFCDIDGPLASEIVRDNPEFLAESFK
jgi:hypothetical protein